MQDIFTGLSELHRETPTHKCVIHGRIRLPSLFYFRSTGQVRVGGYYWLTEAHPDLPYKQIDWAKEDRKSIRFLSYRLSRVFST